MRYFINKVMLVTAVLFAGYGSATAQLTDSVKAELRKASDKLYHGGNLYYMQVDAICDGYLPVNGRCELRGSEGNLTLNGVALPLEYTAKEKAFYAENYRQPWNGRTYWISSGSLEDIFSAKNDAAVTPFRYVGSGYEGRADKYDARKIITHLLAMMTADRVIDTSQYFAVHFNTHHLTVNNKPVDKTLALKYANALTADGFDLAGDIGDIRYDNDYRKADW